MGKGLRYIEVYFLYIAAFLGGIISILDFFGFLGPVPWLSERMRIVTLLLSSVILGIAAGIMRKLDVVESLILDLQKSNQQNIFQSLKKQIDPNLEAVFGDHISDFCIGIELAVRNREIHLHDVDLHRYFYKQTLKAFPRATFTATSLPYQKFFWKNPPLVLNSLKSF